MALTITSIILMFCMTVISSANVDYDGSVYVRLYHALNTDSLPRYTERGNLTITSLRQGSSTIVNNPLTQQEFQQLSILADTDAFYRVKFLVTNFDGSTAELLSSLKSSMLANSQLRDILIVSLDHSGHVIAITESVLEGSSSENSQLSSINKDKFETAVFVQHSEQGTIPDTASYIQKIEREREARERGESKDNRSFLAKYWMYILPVVIFMLITSAANPEAAASGAR